MSRYRDGGSYGSAVAFPTRIKGPLPDIAQLAVSTLVPEPVEGSSYFMHNLGDVQGMLAYAAGYRNGYRENGMGDDWAGTRSLQEAFGLAINGWDEASAIVDKLAGGLVKAIGSKSILPEPYLSEEGESVDVSAFMSGEPEAFINFRPIERDGAGKLIKVTLNNCVSAGIETDVILARGAAVLAAVRLLEVAGFSVEVVLLSSTFGRGPWSSDIAMRHAGRVSRSGSRDGYTFNLAATVKYADQPTDMGSLAFWLCHPSAFRQITFQVWDRWGLHSPYSMGKCPDDIKGDIHVDEAHLYSVQWSSTDSATKWIKEQLVKQGVEIE